MSLLANAGTPLIWAPMGHLMFGNVLIAIVETFAIVLIFRLRVLPVFGLTLAANFTSFIVGHFGLHFFSTAWQSWVMPSPPIFGLRQFIVALVIAAFLLSLIVEWPILRYALARPRRTVGRTLAVAVVAQVISHALLVPYYLSAGVNTIPDQARLERTAAFACQPEWWVYYIAPDADHLRRVRCDGSSDERVADIPPVEGRSRTWVEERDDGRLWMVREQFPREGGGSYTVPLIELGDPSALPAHARQPKLLDYRRRALSLEAARPVNDDAGVYIYDWAYWGLRSHRGDTKRYIAVELPFLAWDVNNGTLLPGDQVIFQLGPQIVLYDLNTTQLAVLAMGSGPCVLPTAPPTTAPASSR